MKFQNINSENIQSLSQTEYFENSQNKYKNPYLKINNSEEKLTIEIDNFACHNLFYFYDDNEFLFGTNFIELVKKVKKKRDCIMIWTQYQNSYLQILFLEMILFLNIFTD